MGENWKEPPHTPVNEVKKIKTEKKDFIAFLSLFPHKLGNILSSVPRLPQMNTNQSVYDVNRRSIRFLINSELPRLNGHIGGSLHSVFCNYLKIFLTSPENWLMLSPIYLFCVLALADL